MAKIRTLKRGKRWSFAFEMGVVNGKRKTYQKSGFDTKQKAYNAGAIAYDKYLHGGLAVNNGKITFADFLDEWFEKECKPSVRHSTAINYSVIINKHIKPQLGSYKMNALTPAIINNWLNQLFTCKQLCHNTISAVLITVRKALTYAVYPAEILTTNPAQYIKLPKKIDEEKQISRVIIRNIENIKCGLGRQSYCIPVIIAYYTGMRIGEVMGLTWQDIDFKNKRINIDKQVTYISYKGKYEHLIVPPKTNNSIRTVLIGNSLIMELKSWRAKQAENKLRRGKNYLMNYGISCDLPRSFVLKQAFMSNISSSIHKLNFICTNEEGGLLSRGLLNSFSRILKKKGIVFNFHSLRHTQATLAIENGAKVVDVANRLGDTVNTVQATYAHDTIEMQKETVAIIENIGIKAGNADK